MHTQGSTVLVSDSDGKKFPERESCMCAISEYEVLLLQCWEYIHAACVTLPPHRSPCNRQCRVVRPWLQRPPRQHYSAGSKSDIICPSGLRIAATLPSGKNLIAPSSSAPTGSKVSTVPCRSFTWTFKSGEIPVTICSSLQSVRTLSWLI